MSKFTVLIEFGNQFHLLDHIVHFAHLQPFEQPAKIRYLKFLKGYKKKKEEIQNIFKLIRTFIEALIMQWLSSQEMNTVTRV